MSLLALSSAANALYSTPLSTILGLSNSMPLLAANALYSTPMSTILGLSDSMLLLLIVGRWPLQFLVCRPDLHQDTHSDHCCPRESGPAQRYKDCPPPYFWYI